MEFMDFFVIFVLIVIIYFYIKKYYGEVENKESVVDHKSYLVRKLPDSQKAADILAALSTDSTKLINHMMAKYPDNKNVQRLYKNFSADDISEGSPESGYTSYSINKTSIVLCLRQKDDKNTFADMNVIRYVLFHELSHLMTESVGHTKEFWDNFKFLLTEAVAIGVYTKVDYSAHPSDYCGIKVTSSVI